MWSANPMMTATTHVWLPLRLGKRSWLCSPFSDQDLRILLLEVVGSIGWLRRAGMR